MIPHSIELKNFLSYGETVQRIDFRQHALICLSGKNGHGKSALLDALTWALWGQARKITGAVKADEGLLHLGQTRMVVSVEFSCGGTIYRVRREFAKTYGRPYAALDYEVFDAQANKFLSLTEKTIKATQICIERVIGLDYETFINSAFIRQGQSNEFSKKSAKERKQVLATILGLTHYDHLQQRALEKVRLFSEEKKGLLLVHEQHAREIAHEEALTLRLAEERQKLEGYTSALATISEKLQVLEHAYAACKAAQQTASTLREEYTALEQTIVAQREQLGELVAAWRQTHIGLLKLPDYNVLHEQKRLLVEQETVLMEQRQKALAVHERMVALREQLNKRQNTLAAEHGRIIEQSSRLVHEREVAYHNQSVRRAEHERQEQEILAKLAAAQRELKNCEQACGQHDACMKNLERIMQQFDKRKAYYHMLVQRGTWIKNECGELEHKNQSLRASHQPSCPLCEQLLTAKRKQFLADRLEEQSEFLTRRLQRVSFLVKKLKEILIAQHEERVAAQTAVDKLHDEQRKREDLVKKIHDVKEEVCKHKNAHDLLVHEEQACKEQLDGIRKQLEDALAQAQQATESDETIKELSVLLASLEREKQLLATDDVVYRQLQLRRLHIDEQIAQLASLAQIYKTQQDRRTQCSVLAKEIKRMAAAKRQLADRLSTFASLDTQEQQLRLSIDECSDERVRHTKEKDLLLHDIGSIASDLSRIETIKKSATALTAQVQLLEREIEDYQAIAMAASKNGIQALLIEEAIPEIEQEANTILERLTDNQAHIFIESLRDLKSGGVKESLDIHISDSAGMRPYEMYSGGEAFRIDFALRIAVAKLLARRAGTALQTLIIDEGFGSQDEEGLSHIMDVLHAIRDDFAKILIVSHLVEFKHNFPVHFIVEKSPSGSVITIEERG
ncbi:MAG: SMC family ATPase [Candidatus Babeliales bacterium]|jgi:exonuclease SbcC